MPSTQSLAGSQGASVIRVSDSSSIWPPCVFFLSTLQSAWTGACAERETINPEVPSSPFSGDLLPFLYPPSPYTCSIQHFNLWFLNFYLFSMPQSHWLHGCPHPGRTMCSTISLLSSFLPTLDFLFRSLFGFSPQGNQAAHFLYACTQAVKTALLKQ